MACPSPTYCVWRKPHLILLIPTLRLRIADTPLNVHRTGHDLVRIGPRGRDLLVRDGETQELPGRVLEAGHHPSVGRQDLRRIVEGVAANHAGQPCRIVVLLEIGIVRSRRVMLCDNGMQAAVPIIRYPFRIVIKDGLVIHHARRDLGELDRVQRFYRKEIVPRSPKTAVQPAVEETNHPERVAAKAQTKEHGTVREVERFETIVARVDTEAVKRVWCLVEEFGHGRVAAVATHHALCGRIGTLDHSQEERPGQELVRQDPILLRQIPRPEVRHRMALADQKPENLPEPKRKLIIAYCCRHGEGISTRQDRREARFEVAKGLAVTTLANSDFDRLVGLAREIRNIEPARPQMVMMLQPARKNMLFVARKAGERASTKRAVRLDVFRLQDIGNHSQGHRPSIRQMVSSPVRWLIAAPSAKLPSASTTLGISLVPEGRRLFQNLTVAENLQLAARPGGINLTTRSRMLLKGILRAALLRHQQALLGDKLIASKNLAA
jgi:hypothetical protein